MAVANIEQYLDLYAPYLRKLAYRYSNDLHGYEDLYQEARLTAIKAFKNNSNNNTIATYLNMTVEFALKDYVKRKSRLINNITTNLDRLLYTRLYKYNADKNFTKDQKQEIMCELDITLKEIEQFEQKIDSRYVSLQAYDFDIPSNYQDPCYIAMRDEGLDIVLKRFNDLSTREQEILQQCYFDANQKTFTEMGLVYGISTERVRQIALKAWETLENGKKKTRQTD